MILLLAVMFAAACQTLALPRAGRHDRHMAETGTIPVTVDAAANEDRIGVTEEVL